MAKLKLYRLSLAFKKVREIIGMLTEEIKSKLEDFSGYNIKEEVDPKEWVKAEKATASYGKVCYICSMPHIRSVSDEFVTRDGTRVAHKDCVKEIK